MFIIAYSLARSLLTNSRKLNSSRELAMRFKKLLTLSATAVLGCASPELDEPVDEITTGKNQAALSTIEPTTGANIFFVTANLRRAVLNGESIAGEPQQTNTRPFMNYLGDSARAWVPDIVLLQEMGDGNTNKDDGNPNVHTCVAHREVLQAKVRTTPGNGSVSYGSLQSGDACVIYKTPRFSVLSVPAGTFPSKTGSCATSNIVSRLVKLTDTQYQSKVIDVASVHLYKDVENCSGAASEALTAIRNWQHSGAASSLKIIAGDFNVGPSQGQAWQNALDGYSNINPNEGNFTFQDFSNGNSSPGATQVLDYVWVKGHTSGSSISSKGIYKWAAVNGTRYSDHRGLRALIPYSGSLGLNGKYEVDPAVEDPPPPGTGISFAGSNNWWHTSYQGYYGNAGDVAFMGDWDGNGTFTPGVWRNGNFYFSDDWSGVTHHHVPFGLATDKPLVGDWNGDGTWTAGIWRNAYFYMTDFTDGPGVVHYGFQFGNGDDTPIVGDWDGNGTFTPGVYRPGSFIMSNDGIWPSTIVNFGNAGDTPLVGDWNGDGAFTPGVWRAGWFYGTDTSNGSGVVHHSSQFGLGTSTPLVGDFDGNGTFGPGVRH
jgi:endonuclease/exonuclease/phosphatase family metal-dependent hydrolase